MTGQEFTPQIERIRTWIRGSRAWTNTRDARDSLTRIQDEKKTPDAGDDQHLRVHRLIIQGIHVKWTRSLKNQKTQAYAKGGGWCLPCSGRPDILKTMVKLIDSRLGEVHKTQTECAAA